jgi:hypothetical protein
MMEEGSLLMRAAGNTSGSLFQTSQTFSHRYTIPVRDQSVDRFSLLPVETNNGFSQETSFLKEDTYRN